MTGTVAAPPALELPSPGEVILLGRQAEYVAWQEEALAYSQRKAQPLQQRPGGAPEVLKVCILAPRVDVGGGARILLEHANRLADRGHEVTVLAHYPAPDWFPLRCRYRHVPVGANLTDAIPPCDVVVCGYWEQVIAARAARVAPVVHFEQGDFHLFEELAPERLAQVRNHVQAADFTTTVSSKVATVLADRYRVKDVQVIHNAIDPGIFFPPGAPPASHPYVLCVGWDGNEFKGIAEVRQAWEALVAQRPGLEIVWVTPKLPQHGPLGRVVVAPSQTELADLYRGAAVYVCASHYESFPLPPLEAMACGTPVVTTDNVGVLEYAVDGENALIVPIGDVDAMVDAIGRALDDQSVARSLREGGRRTAGSFAWDTIISGLEHHYRTIASSQVMRNSGMAWQDLLESATAATAEAQARLELAKATVREAEIWVPVARPGFAGHEVVTWELAARRCRGGRGRLRVLALHRSARAHRALPYQDGISAFAEGKTQTALDIFLRAHEAPWSKSRATTGALVKWVGLAMAELNRLEEAIDVLSQGLRAFPDNPDYIYLLTLVASATGRPVDLSTAFNDLALIGEGTRYLDWFARPDVLLAHKLQPAAA